jgi:hypothetical protein
LIGNARRTPGGHKGFADEEGDDAGGVNALDVGVIAEAEPYLTSESITALYRRGPLIRIAALCRLRQTIRPS